MSGMDYSFARSQMVETQVRPNDVTHRGLNAMLRAIPREVFVPKSSRELAYAEVEVETLSGRWLWRIRELAKLIQALDPQANNCALVVGCGEGYSVAVLAGLVDTVVGIESTAGMVIQCEKNLVLAEASNTAIVEAPLAAGLPKQAPFDIILIGGAVEEVPQALLDQLSEGGRLGAIIRQGRSSRAVLFTKSNGMIASRVLFDASVPTLPGFEKARSFEF
jgi:protein-L-isoaspartate(D-aspartate) O-methyltransferase